MALCPPKPDPNSDMHSQCSYRLWLPLRVCQSKTLPQACPLQPIPLWEFAHKTCSPQLGPTWALPSHLFFTTLPPHPCLASHLRANLLPTPCQREILSHPLPPPPRISKSMDWPPLGVNAPGLSPSRVRPPRVCHLRDCTPGVWPLPGHASPGGSPQPLLLTRLPPPRLYHPGLSQACFLPATYPPAFATTGDFPPGFIPWSWPKLGLHKRLNLLSCNSLSGPSAEIVLPSILWSDEFHVLPYNKPENGWPDCKEIWNGDYAIRGCSNSYLLHSIIGNTNVMDSQIREEGR
jgi:hypothetical protein